MAGRRWWKSWQGASPTSTKTRTNRCTVSISSHHAAQRSRPAGVPADSAGGAQSDSLDSLTTSRADLVTQQDRLEALGADLQDERLTPAAALDELDALRRRLTGLVSALADAEVAAFGKDEAERELLRDELRSHRGPARSARGSILDSALPADAYWTVVAFTTGHQAGERSVQDHRQAQSSSSGTGYGSSGGSFSGAGSSGRF